MPQLTTGRTRSYNHHRFSLTPTCNLRSISSLTGNNVIKARHPSRCWRQHGFHYRIKKWVLNFMLLLLGCIDFFIGVGVTIIVASLFGGGGGGGICGTDQVHVVFFLDG